MDLRPTTDRILMSDILKGTVPELEEEDSLPTIQQPTLLDEEDEAAVTKLQQQSVHVVLDMGEDKQPLVGLLYSALFDERPELEIRVDLTDALALCGRLNTEGTVTIKHITLLHGVESALIMRGSFALRAARLQEIEVSAQTCVLHCLLERPQAVTL